MPQVARVRRLFTKNLASDFDPSILRHSGIWVATDEAGLNKVHTQKIISFHMGKLIAKILKRRQQNLVKNLPEFFLQKTAQVFLPFT
jgi:hypothetical protein